MTQVTSANRGDPAIRTRRSKAVLLYAHSSAMPARRETGIQSKKSRCVSGRNSRERSLRSGPMLGHRNFRRAKTAAMKTAPQIQAVGEGALGGKRTIFSASAAANVKTSSPAKKKISVKWPFFLAVALFL